MSLRWVIVGCLVCCGGAWGDVVQTSAGRVEAMIEFGVGCVKVGQKQVAAEDVQMVVREGEQTISASQALELVDGEVWYGEVSRVAAKKVKFSSAMLGEREIDLEQVKAIDFVAHPDAGSAAGTLYREVGEPIPGRVMFIDPQKLTLESPLGVIALPREGLLRYVFAEPKGAVARGGEDELRLIDGSLFKGKLTLLEGKVELEHGVLGKLVVPTAAVRAVVREGVVRVSELEVERASLVATQDAHSGPLPEYRERENGVGEYLRAYRIEPTSTVTMTLPAAGTLKAWVAPLENSQGAVKVTVLDGGQKVVEKTLAAGDGGMPVSLDCKGQKILLSVDFAGAMQFPSGVLLCDPVIVPRR